MINSQGGIEKKAVGPGFFFPYLEPEPEEQTPEEQMAIWRRMGARDLRHVKH